MCGIVGILYTDHAPVSREILETMTASLSHRGPDGWGTEVWDEVGIGHRRLAIIDLEGGKQPLSNEDGQVWITLNGEIYNYLEMRCELETRGHIFRTNSDTETVVHAYETWGDRCVEHFRGMYAFAIVDLLQRRLFLARDHLGIKPLYYLQSTGCFAFASELQALRLVPGQQFTLDLQAIDQYLWLQYIPAPHTVFHQIRKLPPAHRMSVTFDGKVSEPEKYWHLEFKPDNHRSESEWLEAIDQVLRDSVRAHLVADVPFGAFLSGGVDSSAIVAYMAQILQTPVKTFSIGFEENAYNELKYAEIVAKRWGTEHHVEIVKPDALAILPRLVKHYGEPFGDSSAIPSFYVCQMARRSVPMVLSGDGGDELFAGYDSYRTWMKWLSNDGRPVWKQRLYPLAHAFFPKHFSQRQPTLANWLRFINYIPVELRRTLWRSEYRSVCNSPLKLFECEFKQTQGYSPCHKAQYMDIKTYLPYDIMTKVDIASMAHGLEVRTPIVDIRVVEFAATIPDHLNMRRSENGEWCGKALFKQAMQRFYPAEFLNRPKMGFAIPIQKWFAPDGALRGTLQERLLGTDSRLTPFFQPRAIRSMLARNVTGPLWLLLSLDEWLRQNEAGVSW
jgi:asparagine synthase (glutamine-hydrolysing)